MKEEDIIDLFNDYLRISGETIEKQKYPAAWAQLTKLIAFNPKIKNNSFKDTQEQLISQLLSIFEHLNASTATDVILRNIQPFDFVTRENKI